MKVVCFMYTLTGNCPYGKATCKGEHVTAPKPPPMSKSKLKIRAGGEFRPTNKPLKKSLKKTSKTFNVNPKQTKGKLRAGQSFNPNQKGQRFAKASDGSNLMSMLGDSYGSAQQMPNYTNNPMNAMHPMNAMNMSGMNNMGLYNYGSLHYQMLNQPMYQNTPQIGYNYQQQQQEEQEEEEWQEVLDILGYDKESLSNLIDLCSDCTCCNGSPINCPNCAAMSSDPDEIVICSCFLQLEAENNIIQNQNSFNPEFGDCECCHGYIDNCKGDVCKDLGICQCVMRKEMEDDEIDYIVECKDCKCCKGKVYECPQKLYNCSRGNCGCFK